MKKIIVLPLFTLLLSPVGSAAPLCSKVLKITSLVSSGDEVDLVIQNIAEMKLQADVNKSSGKKTAATNVLLKDFNLKYQELIEKLQGKISEEQLRHLIAQKITQLQGRDVEVAKEKSIQNKKTKANKTNIFEHKKTIDIEFSGRAQSDYVFLPKAESLFFFQFGNLKRLDLKTGKDESLGTGEIGTLLSDGKTLLFELQDKLVEYNTETESFQNSRQIQYLTQEAPIFYQAKFATTKTGQRVLITGDTNMKDHVVSIIDRETGKELLNQNSLSQDLKNVTLLTDKLLLVVREGNRVDKVEIETGRTVQTAVIPFTKESSSPPQLVVSGDGRIVTALNQQELFSLTSSNLTKQLSYSDVRSPQPNNAYRNTVLAPTFPTAFIEADFSAGARLFLMNPLRVEFDFEAQYSRSKKHLLTMSMSPDGDQIVAIYSNSQSSTGMSVDIWQRLKLDTLF